MNVVDHEDDSYDGKKVWLSEDETQKLVNTPDDSNRAIAFKLAARCGLRSAEVLKVSPDDIYNTDVGHIVKVEEGKGDKYREAPIPDTLVTQINTADNYRDADSSEPIVPVTTTQSLRNWIQTARETLMEVEDDDRWQYVSMHDLRRTWATGLADMDVEPLIVCEWAGWDDISTFKSHYKDVYRPEAQERERKKVEWL